MEKSRTKTPELTWSPDEQNVVELCLRNLPDDEIAQCREEIKRTTISELQNEDYGDLLVATMVPALVRSVRRMRLGRILEASRLESGSE